MHVGSPFQGTKPDWAETSQLRHLIVCSIDWSHHNITQTHFNDPDMSGKIFSSTWVSFISLIFLYCRTLISCFFKFMPPTAVLHIKHEHMIYPQRMWHVARICDDGAL
uniref:Uncharacterized protein n=1 Tax=Eutreptiella gymnastica TaxID=73025 RepID=A0A6U8GYT7_9EUGL